MLTRLKVNGCDIHLKDTVIIAPLSNPKISITGNTPVCIGKSAQLTVQSTSVIKSYAWSPATGLSATNAASVKATPVKTTQYVVLVTDANGCTAKDSVILIVNPLPTVTLSSDTAICSGEKVTLYASGGKDYSWTPAAGLNVSNAASVIASPATTTQYVVTVTDANGCAAKDSVKLTVNPIPLITVSADTSICIGEQAILTAGGGVTYNWSPATGLNATTGATVIASPAVTTQYVVTGTSSNGCSANDTVNVSILPCGFLVTVTGGSVCEDSCFTLKTKVSGGTGPYTYSWQPGNAAGDSLKVCPTAATAYTVTVTDKNGNTGKGIGFVKLIPKPTIVVNSEAVCKGNPATFTASGASAYIWSTGSTGATLTVSPPVTTTYTVTGITSEGCTNTAVATVSIKPKPVVDFAPDTAGCAPLIVKFKNLSTDMVANSTCSWDFGNTKKSQTCDPHEVVYLNPGTYSVSLTVDNGGCSTKLTRPCVTVYPLPKAFFTADPKITDIYDPTITFINESDIKGKINWSFGDGKMDSTNAPVLKHTYKEEGTYHVCLKVEMSGCAGEYCTDVLINPGWSFYIPNAFVPESYGPNSIFRGKGENISAYSLMIFNRWGNLVFETNNLDSGWNGKVNNGAEIAQQDVYVYKVSFKDGLNKQHQFIGSVTLLK